MLLGKQILPKTQDHQKESVVYISLSHVEVDKNIEKRCVLTSCVPAAGAAAWSGVVRAAAQQAACAAPRPRSDAICDQFITVMQYPVITSYILDHISAATRPLDPI